MTDRAESFGWDIAGSIDAEHRDALVKLAALNWFDEEMARAVLKMRAGKVRKILRTPQVDDLRSDADRYAVHRIYRDVLLDPDSPSAATTRNGLRATVAEARAVAAEHCFGRWRAMRLGAGAGAFAVEAVAYQAKADPVAAADRLIAVCSALLQAGQPGTVLRAAREFLDATAGIRSSRSHDVALLVHDVALTVADTLADERVDIDPPGTRDALVASFDSEVPGMAGRLAALGPPRSEGEAWLIEIAEDALRNSAGRYSVRELPAVRQPASTVTPYSRLDEKLRQELTGHGVTTIRQDDHLELQSINSVHRRSTNLLLVPSTGDEGTVPITVPVVLSAFPWSQGHLVDSAVVHHVAEPTPTLTSSQAAKLVVEYFVRYVTEERLLDPDDPRDDPEVMLRRLHFRADSRPQSIPQLFSSFLAGRRPRLELDRLVAGVPLIAVVDTHTEKVTSVRHEAEHPVARPGRFTLGGRFEADVEHIVGHAREHRIRVQTPPGFVILRGDLRLRSSETHLRGRVSEDGYSQSFFLTTDGRAPDTARMTLRYAIAPRYRLQTALVAGLAAVVSIMGLALAAYRWDEGLSALFSAVTAASLLGLIDLVLRRGLGEVSADSERLQRRALLPSYVGSAGALVAATVASAAATLNAAYAVQVPIFVVALLIAVAVFGGVSAIAWRDHQNSRRYAMLTRGEPTGRRLENRTSISAWRHRPR